MDTLQLVYKLYSSEPSVHSRPPHARDTHAGNTDRTVATPDSPRDAHLRIQRSTVIFDGDDTLWETQPLYERAKELFFETMAALGFAKDEVSSRLDAIDRTNVAVWGFSKARFPQSMRDTYQSLCIDHGTTFDRGIASRIRTIGEYVFETTPRLFDGALQVMRDLRSRGMTLILATKGDPDVQKQRIKSLGLRASFDRIYILADKGLADFENIVTECGIDVSVSWSVGNSLRADIRPALAVGLNAIWIPNVSWSYEAGEVVIDERFRIATSIKEVPGIVASVIL